VIEQAGADKLLSKCVCGYELRRRNCVAGGLNRWIAKNRLNMWTGNRKVAKEELPMNGFHRNKSFQQE